MTDSEKEKARIFIAQARKTFDAALQKAQRAGDLGAPLTAAVWAQVAADFAFHKHPGIFCSPELESLLQKLAAGYVADTDVSHPSGKTASTKKARLLHVMTNAYVTGGHTRLVQRLALNWAGSHMLVTTAQRGDLPQRLKTVFCADNCNWLDLSTPGSDLLSRAWRLRQISRKEADLVILHSHPFDVVPTLAFGVPGGPPVVMVNHSDHTFWVGTSVVDAVADLRLIGQELTLSRRQAPLSRVLPIPLPAAESGPSRAEARARLGIEENSVVLLTIASPYKFTPIGGYHFLDAVAGVLKRHKNAMLVACGPNDEDAWKSAGASVGGRIRACGVQKNISDFHAAADIYLDPFPYASLTSMLESALHSVPVLGMANVTAPTFTDGSIIEGDGWIHAASLEEYQQRLSALISDPQLRATQGAKLRRQVADRHLMPGWGTYLDGLLQALPAVHDVRPLEPQAEQIDDTDHFLARMAEMTSGRYSVNTSLRKHGGCLPARDRCRLLIKGILGIDGLKLLPVATYRGKELFS